MHCPSCGTENVPDSRFCGTCGAKLTPAVVSRVAPTAKIPDDAPFSPPVGDGSRHSSLALHNNFNSGPPSIPPNANYQAQPASIPPNTYIAPQYSTGPASVPPQNHGPTPPHLHAEPRPASIPPNTYQAQGYAREPSVSMPVPTSPRWGLILFLLVLDVGLAGAGALLLQKGLAKPAAATEKLEPKAAPARAASAGSAAPVTATAPQTGLAASVTAIAQTAPAATAPAPVPPAPQVIEKRPVAKAKGGSPENPYDAKSSLPGEVELAAARSKDDLAKCQTAEEGPPHGRIDIAFTIERDGSVSRVNATKDTTGSRTLARCLISVIRQWAFASHPANSTNFVRPFIYN